MESNNLSLNHEQCLTTLHNQIEEELKEFKNNKFNLYNLFRSFITKNKYKFIHNLLPIFICSLCLFICYEDNFLPNVSNAIIIFLLTCFNLACILFVYFKRASIIYNKAKFVLTLIQSK